jgi:NAD(P)-dependent dehydrogenase (short-subunit alcohol dehydrogenase family)
MEIITPNSYVLVTGGAGGIGSATCKLLASIGLKPIVGFNTNLAAAHDLAEELGGFALKLDMSMDSSIDEAISTVVSMLTPDATLSGVILGASPPPDLMPFSKLSSHHLSNQFRVNVIGSQLLLSGLIKKIFRKNKSGIIIGILSEAMGSENDAPATGMGAYIIAKEALNSMLSVCASEYPWLKIRTIKPGFTKTPMLDTFDPRYLELIASKKPISTPQEIARLIIQELLL